MTSYDLFHVLSSMESDEAVTFLPEMHFVVLKGGKSLSQTVEDVLIDQVPDKPAYFAMQISDMLGHLRRGEGGKAVGT